MPWTLTVLTWSIELHHMKCHNHVISDSLAVVSLTMSRCTQQSTNLNLHSQIADFVAWPLDVHLFFFIKKIRQKFILKLNGIYWWKGGKTQAMYTMSVRFVVDRDTILSVHSNVFDVEHMNASSKWRPLQCSLTGLSYTHSQSFYVAILC